MPEPSSDPKRSVPGTPAPHMAGRKVPKISHTRRSNAPLPTGTIRSRKPRPS